MIWTIREHLSTHGRRCIGFLPDPDQQVGSYDPLAPVTGLEPVTYGLTVRRSTDWTKREYQKYNFLSKATHIPSTLLVIVPYHDLPSILETCALSLQYYRWADITMLSRWYQPEWKIKNRDPLLFLLVENVRVELLFWVPNSGCYRYTTFSMSMKVAIFVLCSLERWRWRLWPFE